MTEQEETGLTTDVGEVPSGAEDCREKQTKRVSAREEGLERQGSAPEGTAASGIPLVSPGRAECFLGIDIGSISTKGVIVDADRAIVARSYLWTEGNPTDAARRVVADLGAQIDHATMRVRAVGTTGSARRLVGAMLGAAVVKNEITAHAVGTTYLHPDVRTIPEIGGQDSKIICV